MSRGLFDGAGPKPAAETIEGVVERITYTNEENGWTVAKLQLADRPQPVTVVGALPGVQAGESLRLDGSWVQDRKWGEQFRVSSFISVQPSTLVGIERYLGSGLIRGLGQVMAGRLVERFQYETLEVIDRQPHRLTEVEGIGPKRRERIEAAWQDQKAIKEVMLFLQSHGVSAAHGVKIFKQYGERAISILRADPYRLAVDVHGIGFKTADRIAANLGVPPGSPQRAQAGLLHVLSACADEGHLYCPREALLARAAEMLAQDRLPLEQALERLANEQAVALEPAGDDQAVYSRPLHTAEVGAASRLIGLLAEPAAPLQVNLAATLRDIEKLLGIELASQQREAISRALSEKVLVITGGPGTGKTTIIRGILSVLRSQGVRVLLCAPTGRAAKRLSETTGQEARTIHRLLEFNPRARSFERNQHNPLRCEALVIDEASMVDLPLCYHLLKALPTTARLVAVGDVDQLPSVGPGLVLRDLIRSGRVGVVRLSEIFRQARQSLIVLNAHRVNSGELPQLPAEAAPTKPGTRKPDFYFIEREDPEAVLATIKELVGRRIPARFGLDPLEQVQVLTPMHRGLLGSINLNAQLQALLNPAGEAAVVGSRQFRAGDKVLQVRNNYELEVFNGDIGRIVQIDSEERRALIRFDERQVSYDFAEMDELLLGYACSIHKAQGSEYPAVLIPLHTQHYTMLQRNLLYTGITRGRQLVVLVGSSKALALAVRNSRVQQRYSRLAERLERVDSSVVS